MKLSPPASSSDLESAREIARRLHQQRRSADRPVPDARAPFPAPAPAPAPTPAPTPAPAAAPAPAIRLPSPIRAIPPEATDVEAPEGTSWDETTAEAARATVEPIDPLAAFGETASPQDDEDEHVPDIEVDEPGVSPEELVGVSVEDLEPSTEEVAPPSPFDVDLDETEAPAEELRHATAPPSWDDIVETCLGLAQAGGAMLVDPAGQVFAARGDWPAPGPDAIAAKLVATMARTLKDAPTRSISAPLMGKHLTAWRVPLAEGLVTAAFIGSSPVRAESRPGIDTEIHRGAGA